MMPFYYVIIGCVEMKQNPLAHINYTCIYQYNEASSYQKTPLQVWILCNDCNDTTEVYFHILGQKCGHCRSYNTRTVAPPVLPQWPDLLGSRREHCQQKVKVSTLLLLWRVIELIEHQKWLVYCVLDSFLRLFFLQHMEWDCCLLVIYWAGINIFIL